MHPVTAAAFEFHSPKQVKLFINSSQVKDKFVTKCKLVILGTTASHFEETYEPNEEMVKIIN